MKDYEVIRTICERLWDPENNDCKAAELAGFKNDIIRLFEDCYTLEDFCKWLAKNDCNPAKGFDDADIYFKDDCDTDEEWGAICDDALFYNDEAAIVRW